MPDKKNAYVAIGRNDLLRVYSAKQIGGLFESKGKTKFHEMIADMFVPKKGGKKRWA